MGILPQLPSFYFDSLATQKGDFLILLGEVSTHN